MHNFKLLSIIFSGAKSNVCDLVVYSSMNFRNSMTNCIFSVITRKNVGHMHKMFGIVNYIMSISCNSRYNRAISNHLSESGQMLNLYGGQ